MCVFDFVNADNDIFYLFPLKIILVWWHCWVCMIFFVLNKISVYSTPNSSPVISSLNRRKKWRRKIRFAWPKTVRVNNNNNTDRMRVVYWFCLCSVSKYQLSTNLWCLFHGESRAHSPSYHISKFSACEIMRPNFYGKNKTVLSEWKITRSENVGFLWKIWNTEKGNWKNLMALPFEVHYRNDSLSIERRKPMKC